MVSIIAWTLILWEWLRLYERTVAGWSGIEQAIDDLCRGRAIDRQAVERTGKNFIGELLSSDLLGRRFDRLSFKARIQPLLNGECVMFQRSLRTTAVLAASMPLLGLLGTVLGMIQTFNALTDQGVARVDALAGGISQALITTQAGLVIAAPVLLANGYLAARIRRYLDMSAVMLKKIETAVCV